MRPFSASAPVQQFSLATDLSDGQRVFAFLPDPERKGADVQANTFEEAALILPQGTPGLFRNSFFWQHYSRRITPSNL
jgi:hypothetical protein